MPRACPWACHTKFSTKFSTAVGHAWAFRSGKRTDRKTYRCSLEESYTAVLEYIILVDLGDFGQIPGPSSVLFWRVLRVLLLLRFCVIIILYLLRT
jgi:hypothetical protein